MNRPLRTGWLWWRQNGSALVTMLAVGVSFLSVYLNQVETAERRDQSCRTDETKQENDVKQLRRTYEFIEDPPEELRDLVPMAMAQVAEVEADAVEDDAADFCDEDGVGLDEPDPVLPLPPAVLAYERFPKRNLP